MASGECEGFFLVFFLYIAVLPTCSSQPPTRADLTHRQSVLVGTVVVPLPGLHRHVHHADQIKGEVYNVHSMICHPTFLPFGLILTLFPSAARP